ncbi:N-acetylmuramoyl-L-alanine amidase [Sanguibacter keddieii DSM 10542]|uniref:N-acetylmuramoyl-L-alanine amidase n=1 Tax=Sanguibacter keddieii (strain ATCC 51767 / DSM 10542 / NCFB 3025 / ST-74) TaxID=446469 RepID=D1BER2_SANKS|nr:N-acetylmuramoyl-L-alanine amidase [Sanguibacter keddieii DSM 10542]
MLGALVAAGALATPAAATTPHPVSTTTTEVPLSVDPQQPGTPAAAPASTARWQPSAAPTIRTAQVPYTLDAPPVTLGAVADSTGFAVAGVVWDDTDDVTVSSVQLRTLTGGTWSDWESIEPEESDQDHGPSAGSRTAGTDPIAVGEVDRVEVRVVADGTPANARLAVVDPGSSDADDIPVDVPREGGTPTVLPRSAWGADESIMTWRPQPATVQGTVIHHTAGTNDYTPEQVPAILRGIYTFHAQTNNWGDIGYNFLVDKFGRAWEGRAGGITNATTGAHAFGFNAWTTGISVMGNYTTAPISDAAWDTVADLAAWKLSERGVDVDGTMTVNGRTYPALVGHRDVGVTECPGDQLYERLDELRAAVGDRQATDHPVVGTSHEADAAA